MAAVIPRPRLRRVSGQVPQHILDDGLVIPEITVDFGLVAKVAAGCQATVYKYKKCALKVFKSADKCFERERQVLSRVSHDNIVRLFGSSLKPPSLMMEWVDSDLTRALRLDAVHKRSFRKSVKRIYPNHVRVDIVRQLASAVRFLHSGAALPGCVVVHRDIKPDNVGLSHDGNQVKLLDFGLAIAVPTASNYCLTGGTGSCRYMAPECANYEKYGAAADVFSLALVAWECLALKGKPFLGMDEDSHRSLVVLGHERPPIPSNWDPKLHDALTQAWRQDPRHRATADDLYVTLHGIADAYVATSNDPLALPSSVRRALASLVASHQRKPAWSPRGRDRACTDGDGIDDDAFSCDDGASPRESPLRPRRATERISSAAMRRFFAWRSTTVQFKERHLRSLIGGDDPKPV